MAKRTCNQCGTEIARKPKEQLLAFRKRAFCNHKCYWMSLNGRKRKPFTDEHKKRIGATNSVLMKGRKHPKDCTHCEKIRGKVAHNKGLKGKPLTLEQKKHLSTFNRGEKNHMWKGGVTPMIRKIRNSFEYRLWRTAVFERDNYTCVWCGARCGNGKKVVLNADHIKSFSQFPALRFAIDNGRTLCVSCHRKTDNFGSKAIKK